MFDDHDDEDSDAANPFFDEEHVHAATMLEELRDTAIKLFDKFIEQQSGGVNPLVRTATHEEKTRFLSLQEAENIVRDFAEFSQNGAMAIVADNAEEMNAKVHAVMGALMQRIMTNVIAEGVKQDLIEVAFDDNHNDFCFRVSDAGLKFVEDRGPELFPNWSDEPSEENDGDDNKLFE